MFFTRNPPNEISHPAEYSLTWPTRQFILTHAKTKKELIHFALSELVHRRKKQDLTKLAGRFEFSDDFDPKALRELRHGYR